MAAPDPDPVSGWLGRVAQSVVVAQEVLDDHVDRQLAKLDVATIPPTLLDAVLPPVLRIRETTFELDVQIERSRGVGRGGTVELRGRPATAFGRARFEGERHSLRLSFEVRAVPMPGREQP